MLSVLIELLSKLKIPYLVIFLGAIAVFFSLFKLDSNTIIQMTGPLDLTRLASGGGLMIFGTLLSFLDRSSAFRLPNIAGSWEYHVKDADPGRLYGHGGTAEITVRNGKVTIDGFRRYMHWQDHGVTKESEVTLHWRTTWFQFDEECVLRYDYDMALPVAGARIMGYVRIQVPNVSKPDRMMGIYCILPPFQSDLPNTHWGTIEYVRIDKRKHNESAGLRPPGPPASSGKVASVKSE